MKMRDFFDTDIGRIELYGVAKVIKDEVLGKLVHDNIILPMAEAGFTPVALAVWPKDDGSLTVSYAVQLSVDDLASLPSIYDPPPAPTKKAHKKRGK